MSIPAPQPLTRLGERTVPLVVATALFMHLMDTAALATSLPTMARAFRCDPVDLRFALTSYMVTIAVLVPASAWLSVRFGTKRLFLAAMIVFAVGSACCAFANDVPQLVLARILQGAGGAMMTPVGRSIVVRLMPRTALVRALTLFTLPGIVAPLVGPPLAGIILQQASWRWIFIVNLPVCLAGVIAVAALVPPIEEGGSSRFDVTGFVLVVVGVLLLTALVETGAASPAAVAGKGAALAALALILWLYRRHARRIPDPILDPALFRVATMRISLLAGLFQRLAVGAIPFLLPLLLQSAIGMTPLVASRVMIASAIGGLAARFVVPGLLKAFSFRNVMLICGGLSAVATAAPAAFDRATPVVVMMAALAILGLVRSAFFVPVTAIAYADLDQRDVGQATVLFTIVQQFSLGLGISLAAMLLDAAKGPGAAVETADFALPFVGIALCSAISLAILWPLERNSGEAMRGH